MEVDAAQFNEGGRYRASIGEPNACGSVTKFLVQGSLAMPCTCKEYARFTIYHENGDIDHLDLLSGHSGPEFFQIRQGLLHYQLSRKEFGRIIGDAGMDESKLFAYEPVVQQGGAVTAKPQVEQPAPSGGDKLSN